MPAAAVTSPAILIAAFSGRALAQSAQRAGFLPLVVDCFGDEDLRAGAHAWRALPARVQVGFRRRALLAALDELAAAAPAPIIGLVLGAGFECNPALVAALADRYTILGNDARTIQQVKDPSTFFGTLADLGIRHPETQTAPPSSSAGWLMKRVGGSGGLHIHRCPDQVRPDRRRYFQREIAGEAISAMMIRSGATSAFAFSRQWTNPQPRRPFRYGGAVGWVRLDADVEARIIDICLQLGRTFSLSGMVSFDFLVRDGEPLLLEINPRPGATLDVLDDANGTLFAAHVAATSGQDAAQVVSAQFRQFAPRAAAYLYADRGPLTIPAITWPVWSADRPAPGTRVERGQPIATVMADAASSAQAEARCRERLSILEDLLYQPRNAEEP